MQRPSTRERPARGSVAHLCKLDTVTVPMMVYVAIQVSASMTICTHIMT